VTTTSRTRLAALRAKMAETGANLVALGPHTHMQWLLGFHPHADERPCLLLIGPKGETILMPELNAEGSRAHTDIAFHSWSDAEGPDRALTEALAAVGGTEAGTVVVDETMRADFALLLLDRLPGARHAFGDATVGALRMRKDDSEYATLKENALIADRAVQAGFAAIAAGVKETEIAAAVRAQFVSEGAEPVFTIVGSGPNGAIPHHATGERRLQTSDAIVIDVGGRKHGYSSDITRMAAVGEPPPGYREVHDIVERASQAAMVAARPGVPASAVDDAARGVIAEAGYGQYFVHRTGHGLGLEVHEPPYLTSTSDTILDVGMVFSIEPGIYLPGRFGVRLEEIVILREDGPEILSALPRDLHIAEA
jgi:Xaa-Pro aminopeptidase